MKVYIDNGATTPVDKAVVKAMLPYFSEKFGNPSSLHFVGEEAKRVLEESRAVIAKAIRAKPEEIIFTSGGTESDNLAIKGAAYANRDKGNHIITSKIEHSAVLKTCRELEKEGFKVTYLDVGREGVIEVRDLEKSLTQNTILVTIVHANNEIGTIQPVEEMGRLCREKGVLFHTDAVQSFTKVLLNARNIDLASFSAHKIHGPRGVGALYMRSGVKLRKLLQGGEQEFNLRPGTENVAGIVGFAKAVQLAKPKHIKHMKRLRDKLIDGVLKMPDTILNGSREKRLCNNANISFKYIEGEALGSYLDLAGICTSTGSACTSRNLKPSHVLMAIGLSEVEAHGSLRLTLSRFTTEKEIDYVLEELQKVVKKLRRMSPLTEEEK